MAAPHRLAPPLALTGLLLAACLALGTARAQADPALVARWNFDSGSGADSSGHALDLSPIGAVTFPVGHGGKVAAFDGLGAGLIHAPDARFAPGTSSWSLTAWIAPSAPGTGQTQYVVQWYECGAVSACGSGNNEVYSLFVDPAGLPVYQFRDALNQNFRLSGTTSVLDGNFHLLAGVYDSTTHRAVFYVDAAKVASDSIPGFTGLPNVAAIPLTVGYENIVGWGVPDRFFKGAIDDVRIYRGTLSASEVSSLFTGLTLDAPRPAAAPALRASVAPNPARGAAELSFTLPAAGDVDVQVVDLLGRRVRTLASGARNAGPVRLHWDGADDQGRPAPAGVYRYVVRARPRGGAETLASHATGVLLR